MMINQWIWMIWDTLFSDKAHMFFSCFNIADAKRPFRNWLNFPTVGYSGRAKPLNWPSGTDISASRDFAIPGWGLI